MKLSDLKPGDKATVEIVIDRITHGLPYKITFNVGGQLTLNHIEDSIAEKIEVTNVIRKPVEPAAGQVWGLPPATFDYTILYVDDKNVLIERSVDHVRFLTTTKTFKDCYTFVR